jgi:hypothetical protein
MKKIRTKPKKEQRRKSTTLMATIPPTPTTSHHCQNHPTTCSLHLKGVFESVVTVTFQSAFNSEMHQNNIFIIF